MINQHHELFAVYWRWSDDWLAHALDTGVMRTPIGWTCRTGITRIQRALDPQFSGSGHRRRHSADRLHLGHAARPAPAGAGA